MINRIAIAFEIGAAFAADLVLKFSERDMSPEQREELVEYASDIANRLISKIAGKPMADTLDDKETTTP